MFEKLFQKSKSIIGKNSNGNMVFQNSTFNNAVIVTGSNNEMLKVLGQSGKYDAIQELITSELSAVRSMHPLFPEFSARIDPELNKLVSTPETAEAFVNHPRKIKGTYEIDYKKYPYMDKAETPWAYAYRTQSRVELKTTAYKEFLGNMEDPFPVMTYSDRMITVIGAPEFPEAVEASIVAGEISISIMLRRLPCLEYGKTVFGNISSGHSFNFRIVVVDDLQKTTLNITKTDDGDLNTQLLREKLIDHILKTKNIQILNNGSEFMHSTIKENELNSDLFHIAPSLIHYIESLLIIEKHLGCHFCSKIDNVSYADYRTAVIMSSSLEGKWHLSKIEFDNEIRCDYDHLPDSIFEKPDVGGEIVAKIKVLSISLQGLEFSADNLFIVYKDAKINNIESVRKNIRRKNKNILITVKPKAGKDVLEKYMRFEGISQIH